MAFKSEDWDNMSYSRKLSYQQSLPVDCSFVIGEGANAKIVGAHKFILSKASTIFKSMFSGAYKEADASFNIPLPAVLDYMDFKVVLEYIYYDKTDALELLSLDRLKHVSYLADFYMLDELLNKCHFKIQTKISANHTSFHDFLQIFEYEKKLRRMFSTFLYNNVTIDYQNISKTFPYTSVVLLTNTTIYNLEPPYFYDLLKILASKFTDSERFCLIENYAKIHALKMEEFSFNYPNAENTVNENSETPIPGKTLKEMFELINFKNMTVNEFKLGPAVSTTWTISPEEKVQILSSLKSTKIQPEKAMQPAKMTQPEKAMQPSKAQPSMAQPRV